METSLPGTRKYSQSSFPVSNWAGEGTSRVPFRAECRVHLLSCPPLAFCGLQCFIGTKRPSPHVWLCGSNLRPQEGSHSSTIYTRLTSARAGPILHPTKFNLKTTLSSLPSKSFLLLEVSKENSVPHAYFVCYRTFFSFPIPYLCTKGNFSYNV